MPYFLIDNFGAGLDLRKSAVTAPAGTLRQIRNAHITPGGEIEKRRAFVPRAEVGEPTIGIAAKGGTVFVFKNGADAPVVTPTHTLVSLPPSPGGQVLSRLVDSDIYDGDLYLVCETDDGEYVHYYPETKGQFDYTPIPGAVGSAVRTYRRKIHAVNEGTLHFSAADAPRIVDPEAPNSLGAGFVNLATEDAESEVLVGLEVYFDTLAVMSRRSIQFWTVDPDPLLYQQQQVLRAVGTDAARSLRQFGSGDVLYLSSSGIRSLQARDSSNVAAVSDIGSPIDDLIIEMRQRNSPQYMAAAQSIIEPSENRFWMVFEDKILVLSSFPGPRVTAWSVYEPQFRIKDVVVNDEEVVFLSQDDELFSYGEDVYDETEAEVITPFMTAERPAHIKTYTGVDVACEGKWQLWARLNPQDPNAEDELGFAVGTTYAAENFGMTGESSHIALRLKTKDTTRARLAQVVFHYELGDSG